ncbi:MAG: putative sulfate exporter family transporter [Spirochaetales bacterium]|nr:putative sulfate exporter family transporter [Spirochaetales bacterium]
MKSTLFGIVICVALGIVSRFLASFLPLGQVMTAILLGIVLGNLITLNKEQNKGVTFCEKKLLPLAIALMGFNLDYKVVTQMGIPMVVIIILTILITIASALALGKLFRIDREMSLFCGVGNAFCGSSAIAAVQSVTDGDEEKAGVSIALVNLLGTVGMFALPAAFRFLIQVSDFQAGAFIGAALQAVGQVTAAGFSLNDNIGEVAVIVKMCRILMLTPLLLFLNFWKGNGGKLSVPPYILFFILFSVVASFRFIPPGLKEGLHFAEKAFLTVAMAAVGMKTSLKNLSREGGDALLTGLGSWMCQLFFLSFAFLFLGKVLF